MSTDQLVRVFQFEQDRPDEFIRTIADVSDPYHGQRIEERHITIIISYVLGT